MLASDTPDMRDQKKMATKLHKQFGHPNSAKLITLIRNAGIVNSGLENEIKLISDNCLTCTKFRKPAPRPVVSIPLATKLNETVAIDLKIWGKYYFLVLVDVATRFCAARVIRNKEASTIIKGIFLSWITHFGAPQQIFSDNGGEFNNAELKALGEAYNIKVLNTAAESPWSNGVCERLNAVIGNLVEKIIDDTNCDVETALAWAVAARNALVNKSGFSPNQLVFGFNPAIPEVFHSDPPALEDVTASDMVRRNLSAQNAARQGFIRYESDEKIKRALRSNIRSTNVDDVERGDEVYYKRMDCNKWRGPGNVMFRDGKVVFVRHGGSYVRVHECRLVKAPRSEKDPSGNGGVSKKANEVGKETVVKTGAIQKSKATLANNQSHYPEDDSEEERRRKFVGNRTSTQKESENDQRKSNEPANENAEVTENQQSNNIKEIDLLRMNTGDRIKGVHSNTGEFVSGKIISRAGKMTGRNRFCYNVVKDSDGSKGWMDLSKVNDLSVVPDDVEMIVMFNSEAVMQAKHEEIKNWKKN